MNAFEFTALLVSVLGMIIIAFTAGLKLSGYFYKRAEEEKEYALQRQFVRLKAGADADDPVGPYVPRRKYQLPPEFGERMKQNGRATVSVKPNS